MTTGSSMHEAGSPPEAVDGSFVPVRRSSIATVEVDGRAVLLDETTGALQLLDPIGAAVWSTLDGSGTVDDLEADLSSAFAIDPAALRGDLVSLLSDMKRKGLLEDGAGAADRGDPSVGAGSGPHRPVDPRFPGPRFLAEPPSS